MKKMLKCFSLFLAFMFALVVFNTTPVSANFDRSKNKVAVEVGSRDVPIDNDSTQKRVQLKISITYQRGFDMGTAKYWICKGDPVNIMTIQNCTDESAKVGNNIVREGSPADYISKTSANDSDNNPTTKQFLIDTDIEVDSTQREDTYVVFVVAYFCAVRTVPENNADYSACTYFYDSNTEDGKGIVKTSFKINDILNKNISDIDDDGISQAMNKIEEIIMYTVMPIIWGVLGLFLVVKGALLGIQIVKAADEPQVRQEKIGSLKWLVIGVAVAYLASGAVYVVTGYFSGVFNLG